MNPDTIAAGLPDDGKWLTRAEFETKLPFDAVPEGERPALAQQTITSLVAEGLVEARYNGDPSGYLEYRRVVAATSAEPAS